MRLSQLAERSPDAVCARAERSHPRHKPDGIDARSMPAKPDAAIMRAMAALAVEKS